MFNETNTTATDVTTGATITSTQADSTPRRLGPPKVGDIVLCTVVKPLQGKDHPHAVLATFGSAMGMQRTRDLHGSNDEQIQRAMDFTRGDQFEAMVTFVDLKSNPARFDLNERLAAAFARAQSLCGTTVEAHVVEVTRFGAFVDAGDGINGELFINELAASDQRKRHGELKVGTKLNVNVLGVQQDPRNPRVPSITFSELDAALLKAARFIGSTVTGQVLGPCNSGTRLQLNDGVEAVLRNENLGGTAETSLKKGNNLKVKVLGIEGRSLLVSRDGIGGTNARAIQEAKRAERRQRDQQTRSAMQGSSGGGGGNKGGKGKK